MDTIDKHAVAVKRGTGPGAEAEGCAVCAAWSDQAGCRLNKAARVLAPREFACAAAAERGDGDVVAARRVARRVKAVGRELAGRP